MFWLKRLLVLLALAAVFLLASFLGGMAHSIVAEMNLDRSRLWHWGGGLLVVGLLGALIWRWLRTDRRPTSPSGS